MKLKCLLVPLLFACWFTWGTDQVTANPVIHEFLADNVGGLRDEDGDSPDWIELFNPGPSAVDLQGWALTDVSTNLALWKFPSTNLPAGGYCVVFASGKDRRIPGLSLHTSFRLSNGGEYLALVSPEGKPVPPAFDPSYRPQFPNVSYGQSGGTILNLLNPTDSVEGWVPTDGTLGDSWKMPDFASVGWSSGAGGAAYESTPADYAGLFGLNLGSMMMGKNTTVYLRFPFAVSDPSSLTSLRMKIQYDDGFVAWLNGKEVARRNAPDGLNWNSVASGDHPDGLAVVPEVVDLTTYLASLVPGTNVLAIQGLNVALGSSDFLIRTSLEADAATPGSASAYFAQPTPGAANRGGTVALGPLLQEVKHLPLEPKTNEWITVTAKVLKSFSSVSQVTLFHRIRFGPEVQTPLQDDGLHGDGIAGDGIYGALIPPGAGSAGEMIRYRVEAKDSAGQSSRLPLYLDPQDSEQYYGLVLVNPGIESLLPVMHLFVQNVAAAESFAGTRGCLAYLGEFYDNIEIRIHGQSSSGFPKKSLNLDFNRDHRFRYAPQSPRVKDLKLLTNYGDKSRVHNTLAYEVIAASGSRGHFAFPVRVQRNGVFHGIQDVVEDGDERWLERMGLNPDGALYKVYDSLESAGGSEKKTRQTEGNADLQVLINEISPSRTVAARTTYTYDNIDLPQTISYFVGLALVSSQDHGHKNFYVHRDTTGSGEWSLLPWDVDLTFGRNWTDSAGYFTDTLYTNNVLNFYNSAQQGKPANRFYNLIFGHPEFRAMYLRRLRTVMDTVLQPPGTASEALKIEARIRYWLDQLDPPSIGLSDTDLDQTRWGYWGSARGTRAEAQRIIDVYLPGRRNFLFTSSAATVSGERIPNSQSSQPQVHLDQIDFNPASGLQAEEFVRLTNTESVAVDISGWKLRGQIRHTFRPGTVIPSGKTLYVSPDVAAFRNRTTSPKRGENRYVQGNYSGQLSARGGRVELVDDAGLVMDTLVYAGDPTSLQKYLRLSELMYHPAAAGANSPWSSEEFEFLELKNVGPDKLDLLGSRWTEGILFTFTNTASAFLPPGGRGLLVKNQAAFTSRYGSGLPILGEYTGSLDNSGESLRMQDAQGEVVFEFKYPTTGFPWAEGAGNSLETVSADADLDLSSSWRASHTSGGTPGNTPWPATVEAWSYSGEELLIHCRVEGGRSYQLEFTPGLQTPVWVGLGSAQRGTEQEVLKFSAPMPLPAGSGFLRVQPQ